MEELDYMINLNRRFLQDRMNEIVKEVTAMQAMMTSGEFDIYHTSSWVEGHISQKVTSFASKLAEYQALQQTAHIVKKNQE